MTSFPVRLTQALGALLLVALALPGGPVLASQSLSLGEPASLPAQEPIARIQCPTGYTAGVYAQGLDSPDGLALSPDGTLYVAEEGAGRVSRIGPDGSVTPLVSGLQHPEGIAFDTAGNLYVVEDMPDPPGSDKGRLLKVTPDGTPEVLATGLDAPEGVVWAPDGTLYITESNVQFAADPADFQTHVTALSPSGETTRIQSAAFLWSYSGITLGPGGLLYVANEASGVGTYDSVFSVDPATGARAFFAGNLLAPEGLRFAANGQFPLYVAQEDTGGGSGLLSRVEANGTHSPLCTGFQTIEDVIQDRQGRIYVSEDSTGLIVVIQADPVANSRVRAIILFIGDGMGEAYRNAARWSAQGQRGALAMDRLPALGWSHTAAADSPITDSAAAATAMATGVKTNNGMIGVDPHGTPVSTILEQAQQRGIAVGLVTTVQVAHATPAAFAAHVLDRGMMDQIASQLLAAHVDVLLGGGESNFLPAGVSRCHGPGVRVDGRNLVEEAIASGYTYVCNPADLAALVPTSTPRLLGLFAEDGMPRPFSPSLADMTGRAIDILSRDPDGFFLMVEGGQIDWAGHANNASQAISDTLSLDEAIAVAQTYAANADSTLLIVTADHETGGMSVNLAGGDQGPFAMPEGTPFYVNWTTTGHTAADVLVAAQGPWAGGLNSSYENTHIYALMRAALDNRLYLPVTLQNFDGGSRLLPFKAGWPGLVPGRR